ncbi:MAG: SDR family oxidoreductase [Verrucomicrobiales bacterium]|nr:SDR family oxidoreductase [Verrucomicrobiales bacterium]
MMTLIVGASGATGQKLVAELLRRGKKVKAVVRSSASLPAGLTDSPNLTVIEASVLDLSDSEMEAHLDGCDAVASCLGHNLTFQGMFGNPRKLVTEATRRLSNALKKANADQPGKFVLMNTTGNRNRDLKEPVSFAEKCVISLLRFLLPPHLDNEEAANFLRTEAAPGKTNLEWVVVRPDGLINLDTVTDYELHPSPTRSAIFNAGTTSRINVAHFMADLITEEDLWNEWKGRMPVIYNQD